VDWAALWFTLDAAARLVVSRDLSVLAANRSAQALVNGASALVIRDGVLVARDRRFAADLAGVIAGARPEPGFGIIGADGCPSVLIEAFALGDGGDGPVALSLRDLSASVEIRCADLETVFGVTPGEHQVIVQLLKGYSSREIAEEFGKSILTVRTHVKRAYGKIGVKTRGQLFARLLPYLSIR
jgi:DNA-binding CsgD family transcriptional regulator